MAQMNRPNDTLAMLFGIWLSGLAEDLGLWAEASPAELDELSSEEQIHYCEEYEEWE